MSMTIQFKHLKHLSRNRRGVTMVESAVTLPVLFLLLFALLDLGIAAARYNSLAAASRGIARSAILHGSSAPDEVGTWGPESYAGTGADNSEIVAAAHRFLMAMDEGSVNVQVTWPDGDNSPRKRVQVEVTYRHEPLIPSLFVWGPIVLQSVTTMRIVN